MSNCSTDAAPDFTGYRRWTLPKPAKLAILISGQGSNMQALVEALEADLAQVTVVVSDRPGAAGLTWAGNRGIPTHVVAVKDFADRDQWDQHLAQVLEQAKADLVVSAGFLKILGPRVLEAFPGRIINTHNSLLPSFAGIDGPTQALAAGVKLAGATVFLVDAGMDTGAILTQCAVPVKPGDDEASLLERIKVAERAQLVQTVRTMVEDGWYTRGQIAHLANALD